MKPKSGRKRATWTWSEPSRDRKKWRIRWLDADGIRRSESFESLKTARTALKTRKVEVERQREERRAKAVGIE